MSSVGVIYCDITGLKATNDNLGHKAGDQLICHCYEVLKEVAGTGKIYRFGGDEFIVLCPECTESEFQNTVFELRKKSGKISIILPLATPGLTSSRSA